MGSILRSAFLGQAQVVYIYQGLGDSQTGPEARSPCIDPGFTGPYDVTFIRVGDKSMFYLEICSQIYSFQRFSHPV